MLNSYIKLLQHATEVMTNVDRSNAGAALYFQAVGYEFVVAVPVQYFTTEFIKVVLLQRL